MECDREQSGRLTELDAMRGIAAFAVLIFHATENLPDQYMLVTQILRGSPLRPFLDGRQPVIFFFVLSGLALTRAILSGPGQGFAAYALRRAIRLCLPAAAAVVLSAIGYGLFYAPGPWLGPDTWLALTSWIRPPTFGDILRQAALIGVDGDFTLDPVLWSLVHELRLSMLLPLAVAAVAHRGDRVRMLFSLAGGLLLGLALGDHGLNDRRFDGAVPISLLYRIIPVVLFFWIASRADLPSALRNGPDTCNLVPLLAFCASGIALSAALGGGGQAMLGKSLPASLLATLYFAPCFVLGACLSLGALDRFALASADRTLCLIGALMLVCFDSLFATTAASVLLIVVARQPGRLRDRLRTPPLVFLGRISFSLYLTHVPLLLAMRHGLEGILTGTAIYAVWLQLALPVAWAFHRLVEQPAQRLARQTGRMPKVAHA